MSTQKSASGRFAAVAAALALLVGAVAGAPAANAQSNTTSAATPTPSRDITARQYLDLAVTANAYELRAAEMALEKSSHPAVRDYAQKMVTDHSRVRDMIRQTLPAGTSLVIPDQLPAGYQSLLDTLDASSGAVFDGTYINQQVRAHGDALQLNRRYSTEGDNMELRQLASQMVRLLEEHHRVAEQLSRSVPG